MGPRVLRTIDEWSQIYGVKIIDPDGFDRNDPTLNERLFTKIEFEKGLIVSTMEVVE